jgi:hypothetical protein
MMLKRTIWVPGHDSIRILGAKCLLDIRVFTFVVGKSEIDLLKIAPQKKGYILYLNCMLITGFNYKGRRADDTIKVLNQE